MKDLCVAIGCGAIGKSVSGYIFGKMGFKVVFADAFLPAVDEMADGVYSIFVSEGGKTVREDLYGFEAVTTDSNKFKEYALNARVICTAVGPVGLNSVLPQLAEIFKEKRLGRVQLFLFENDVKACYRAREVFSEAYGKVPEWLDIAGTSIERMTQRYEYKNPAVITEKFFPVFVNACDTENFKFEGTEKFFNRVEDFRAYYYRKLHTNNMGHAILGFCGLQKGYTDTVSAVSDPEINEYVKKCLEEAGEMLIKEYSFTEAEIKEHLKELITRYYGMNDSLKRLAREPLRKLGKGERIIGTILKCLKNSVECPNLCKLVKYTADYVAFCEDEFAFKEIYAKSGIGGVLEEVCGLEYNGKAYNYILDKIV